MVAPSHCVYLFKVIAFQTEMYANLFKIVLSNLEECGPKYITDGIWMNSVQGIL